MLLADFALRLCGVGINKARRLAKLILNLEAIDAWIAEVSAAVTARESAYVYPDRDRARAHVIGAERKRRAAPEKLLAAPKIDLLGEEPAETEENLAIVGDLLREGDPPDVRRQSEPEHLPCARRQARRSRQAITAGAAR